MATATFNCSCSPTLRPVGSAEPKTCPRPSTHTRSGHVVAYVNDIEVPSTQVGSGVNVSMISMALLRRLGVAPNVASQGQGVQVSVYATVRLGQVSRRTLVTVIPEIQDSKHHQYDLILGSDWSIEMDPSQIRI